MFRFAVARAPSYNGETAHLRLLTLQVGLHGARIDVPAEVAAHRLASARTLHHHDDGGGVESASTYGLNGANGGGGYSGYSAHSGTAGPGTPKSTNGQNGHGPNGHGNGHEAAGNGGGGGGGSQHPQALSASARLFRSLRGNREKGLLQQAVSGGGCWGAWTLWGWRHGVEVEGGMMACWVGARYTA